MADITLAEFDGGVWLVGGEPLIDDLLANTLPDDVTIEFVACRNKSDVHALWVQHCGEQAYLGDPWIIHPAIVKRIRRTTPDHAVFFAQWSVFLDDDANAVIRAAARLANGAPDAAPPPAPPPPPPPPPARGGGGRTLRAQLITDALQKAGVSAERILRVRRDVADLSGTGAESQRVDIAVKID